MPGPLPDTFSAARILVVRLSALGDVIRTLPLLPPLRQRFPSASLHWLCEPAARPVLEDQPLIDALLVFPRAELGRAIRGGRLAAAGAMLFHILADIRRLRFDLVVDAQGTYKSGALGRLSGAPVRVGFARGAAKEYLPGAATHPVGVPSHPISRVDKALRLLGPVGADAAGAAAALPERPAAAAEAARLWKAAGPPPRVLLAPGASPRQAYKRWPAVCFGQVARRLSESGIRARVAWGPGEERLARAVCATAGRRDLQLPPTSLPLLAELIRQADLFIGNDSGPAHLAWLVSTRVLALYGPTDPVVNAPWGAGHILLDGAHPGERRRRHPALIERIGVETVVASARQALGC